MAEINITPGQWRFLRQLAAELTLVYRTDDNQLQKTVSYVTTYHPTPEQLIKWLDAQVDNAALFPRSLQTLPHTLAIRELASVLIRQGLEDPRRLAFIMGWVARYMRFYKADKRQGDKVLEQWRDSGNDALLDVSAAAATQLKTVGRRKLQKHVDDKPQTSPDQKNESSDFAHRFEEMMKKRGQQ